MSKFKKNAVYMLIGQLSVALFQGVQFLIVARVLGPSEFGRVAGVVAITAVLLPFSGVGAGNVLVLRMARNDGDVRVYFGNALLVVVGSGLLLSLLAVFWGVGFLRGGISVELMLVFAISEIILTKLIDIAVHVFYGLDQHRYSGFFYALQSALRMLAATALFFVAHASAICWSMLHLGAGAASLAVVLYITIRQIGWPKFDVALALRELKTGVFYSIGLSSKSVYTDIDKAVLARYVGPDIGGAYTAAFRLIFIAYTPVRALLQASMARLFREGSAGVSGPVRFATRIVIWGSLYALFFAMAVSWGAPLIKFLIGDAYVLSVDILRAMALVPLVLLLQDAYSDALMGAGRQGLRSAFQVFVAVLCFGCNMILVPIYSWRGAVATTYLSQALLAILVLGCITVLMQRDKRRAATVGSLDRLL